MCDATSRAPATPHEASDLHTTGNLHCASDAHRHRNGTREHIDPLQPVPHASPPAEPDLTVDGTGLLCVTLLLRLRKEIDGAQPGTVVHVVATDPAAPLDLPAWCHMTGHHYLGPVPQITDAPVYALQIAAGARSTRAGAPWHADVPEG